MLLACTGFARSARAAAGCDLRVAANGRFLERADGTPFLFLSDTEWTLNKHTDEQVLQLLDDRAARGYSVVQVFATRSWSDEPWARTDLDGNLPFVADDVTQLNQPYWSRWAWIADRAAERGLHLMLVFGEPGRLDSSWSAQSDAEAYAYGRAVGAQFRSQTNVIFCNGQDISAQNGIGPSGWRALAEGAADGVNGETSFDNSADYSTTLMTFHGYDVSSTFQFDDWIDFYGPEVWHDNASVFAQISGDYGLANPVRPTALLEGSYETEQTFIAARYVRVEAWHTFLAGGAGYAFGHAQNWQQADNIDYLSSPGNQQMSVLAGFLRGRAWWRLVPDQGILASGEGTGATRKMAARSADGDACWIFFPDEVGASLHTDCVTSAGQVTAWWFDPRDGATSEAGSHGTGVVVDFTPPAGWEDAVLVLEPLVDGGTAADGGAEVDGGANVDSGTTDGGDAGPLVPDASTDEDAGATVHAFEGSCGCGAGAGTTAAEGSLVLALLVSGGAALRSSNLRRVAGVGRGREV